MNAERRVNLQYGMTDSFCDISTAVGTVAGTAAGSRFRAGISLA